MKKSQLREFLNVQHRSMSMQLQVKLCGWQSRFFYNFTKAQIWMYFKPLGSRTFRNVYFLGISQTLKSFKSLSFLLLYKISSIVHHFFKLQNEHIKVARTPSMNTI